MMYNRVTKFRFTLLLKCVLLFSFVVNVLVLITMISDTSQQIQNKMPSSSTKSQRPEICDNCFEHTFEYIINSNGICLTKADTSLPIKLLVLIFSSPDNRKQRKALRETWLTLTRNNTSPVVRHAFLLGKSSQNKTNLDVENEANLFKDMIQENFLDSFENLTLKTVMGLKWVRNECPSVRFVIKTDDDMFINIAAIIRKIIPRHGNLLIKSIGGLCLQNEKPHRSNSSKYYLSKEDYPQSYFPPFCSGTGWITSFHVTERLFVVSKNIPFLKLEGVYIGLCLQYLGYTTINIPFFTNTPQSFDSCRFMFDNVMTSHFDGPDELYKIWNATCNEKINVTYVESLIQ